MNYQINNKYYNIMIHNNNLKKIHQRFQKYSKKYNKNKQKIKMNSNKII